MQGDAMPGRREPAAIAIFATIGGVLGLLTGLLELGPSLGNGSTGVLRLLVILLILFVSVAELALAYSAWTQRPWTVKPWPRAVGFAMAIALILLGVYEIIARVGGL